MRGRSCRDLAELSSAYVDGALGAKDRDTLLVHLVGCDSCRREVAELQRIRDLLSSTRTESAAPPTLSSRLVSIAGAESTAPLWSRPFRRTRSGGLPSTRRARRRRIAAATALLGSLVATLGGIGYAAAPAMDLRNVADPSRRAQAEFASVLTQFPLANDSVNAAVVASVSDLKTTTSAVTFPEHARGHRLHSAQALAVLQRAVQASTEVGYRGQQVVVAPRNGVTVAAQVRVVYEPGQGSQVSVQSTTGTAVVDRFVGQPAASRIVDSELMSLLYRNHNFGGATAAKVAGRNATMVEAVPKDLSSGVVARWWLDEDSGLLLWSETYEPNGALTLAWGFSSVQVGSTSTSFLQHLPPALTTPITTASLTLSNAGALSNGGWFCPDDLAGLSLVRLRTNAGHDPNVVHMVYSDGVSAISVFEERGRLVTAGLDASWDHQLKAYVRAGASSSAVWQSGGSVFTVVTDGSPALLAQAVETLPHGELLDRTTMDRVRAGWVRIVERIVG